MSNSLRPAILVVDDEEMVRDVLRAALTRAGFEVWLAPNGLQAVKIYKRLHDKIALVLLDLLMPELDGPETLRYLQEINPEVKVCILTGTTGYDEPELLAKGALRIFYKPVRLDALTNDLHALVDSDVSARFHSDR